MTRDELLEKICPTDYINGCSGGGDCSRCYRMMNEWLDEYDDHRIKKAYKQGVKDANAILEPTIKEIHDLVYQQGKRDAISEVFDIKCSDVSNDECESYLGNCFHCKLDRLNKRAEQLREQK